MHSERGLTNNPATVVEMLQPICEPSRSPIPYTDRYKIVLIEHTLEYYFKNRKQSQKNMVFGPFCNGAAFKVSCMHEGLEIQFSLTGSLV